jgi:branched-chain amino acid transport system ATP-binding protein
LNAIKISKSFGFPVLQDVSIEVGVNERLGLIGPNGSGKTTLVSIIAGTIKQNSGEIIFCNKRISRDPAYKRARIGIARTFQIPKLFLSLSILDNIMIPLRYAGSHLDEKRGLELLEKVGLETKRQQKPSNLTQIEMRKLELARSLALKPKLLILDEVMAGLTNTEVDETLSIIKEINEQGVAIIMIEHIMRAVMGFCERIVVLNAGKLIANGLPTEIFKNSEVERAYLGE